MGVAEMPTDPREVFELIVAADEKLKYAKAEQAEIRAVQARELLERARDAARAIGNEPLEAQAEQRLADLDAIDTERP